MKAWYLQAHLIQFHPDQAPGTKFGRQGLITSPVNPAAAARKGLGGADYVLERIVAVLPGRLQPVNEQFSQLLFNCREVK